MGFVTDLVREMVAYFQMCLLHVDMEFTWADQQYDMTLKSQSIDTYMRLFRCLLPFLRFFSAFGVGEKEPQTTHPPPPQKKNKPQTHSEFFIHGKYQLLYF